MKKVRVTNPFSVSMKSMTLKEKSSDYLLALPDSSKREKVLDNSDKWISTRPKNVQSLSGDAESLAFIVTTLEQEMKELRKDTDTPIEQMDTTSKCEQAEPPTEPDKTNT